MTKKRPAVEEVQSPIFDESENIELLKLLEQYK